MGDFRISSTRVHFVLVCTIVGAAISTGLGKCPVYPTLKGFDIEKMSGTWYEVERSFYLMEMSASCTSLNITYSDRGYLLITVSTINRWTGGELVTYGVGIPSYTGSSIFRYKINNRLPYVFGRLLPGAGHYHVLFTDYQQFALVWACDSISVAHTDRMWVLGRSREISADLRAQIYGLMQQMHLDPDRLLLSKNNNCTTDTESIN